MSRFGEVCRWRRPISSCSTTAASSPSRGADRPSFLQGLVSNDAAKLAADRAVYAALLTAQGKYLHDFIMVEQGDAIWLDAEAARLADLQAAAVDLPPARQGRRSTSGPTSRSPRCSATARSPRSACRTSRARRGRFGGGRRAGRSAARRARRPRHPAARRAAPGAGRARARARPISPPMTGSASPSASPTAAATWCSTSRSCSKPGSTS